MSTQESQNSIISKPEEKEEKIENNNSKPKIEEVVHSNMVDFENFKIKDEISKDESIKPDVSKDNTVKKDSSSSDSDYDDFFDDFFFEE